MTLSVFIAAKTVQTIAVDAPERILSALSRPIDLLTQRVAVAAAGVISPDRLIVDLKSRRAASQPVPVK